MTLPPRLRPSSWRAAFWALRAWRRCQRSPAAARVGGVVLPPVPPVRDEGRRAVLAALARAGASCLERATVLQAWDLAHDRHRDVVIGVTKPSAGFRAHAWLEGEEASQAEGFTELVRLPPGSPSPHGRR